MRQSLLSMICHALVKNPKFYISKKFKVYPYLWLLPSTRNIYMLLSVLNTSTLILGFISQGYPQSLHGVAIDQPLTLSPFFSSFSSRVDLASALALGHVNSGSTGLGVFFVNSYQQHSAFVSPQIFHPSPPLNFFVIIFNFNFIWFSHEKEFYSIIQKTDILQNKKLKCISQETKIVQRWYGVYLSYLPFLKCFFLCCKNFTHSCIPAHGHCE